jgi:hypothetical protein
VNFPTIKSSLQAGRRVGVVLFASSRGFFALLCGPGKFESLFVQEMDKTQFAAFHFLHIFFYPLHT